MPNSAFDHFTREGPFMLFVIVALTLFASLLVADAEVGAEASDGPESVRVEQVLTAGQIDSRTVDVGAFVVVIYGQGERHPVSGAWAKLDTARGSIKAVDSRRLIVGLAPDGWSKRIALERIQTLSLLGAPLSAVDRDRTHTRTPNLVPPAQAEPEVARSDSLSEKTEAMVKRYYTKAENRDAPRIGKKVAAGVLGGIGGGLVGAAIARNMERRSRSEPEPSTDPSSGYALGSLIATIEGFCIGSMFGAVIGVSLVDRQDNLRITLGHSLAGSVVGLLGGIGLTAASKGTLWPSLFVGPVAMATAWSERSCKPPESRRVSVGLMSEPYGLSAIATLRF